MNIKMGRYCSSAANRIGQALSRSSNESCVDFPVTTATAVVERFNYRCEIFRHCPIAFWLSFRKTAFIQILRSYERLYDLIAREVKQEGLVQQNVSVETHREAENWPYLSRNFTAPVMSSSVL
jgi:hypothetical protein